MPKLDLTQVEREVFGPDDPLGATERLILGEAVGLTQYGVAIETLAPGSRSSERHWHSDEDEFLMMLEGQAVLIEDDGETTLNPGDCAAWAKGVPNAHQLVNRTSEPVRFLMVGTRATQDAVHYPDAGRTTYLDRETGVWRVVAADGTVLREGKD